MCVFLSIAPNTLWTLVRNHESRVQWTEVAAGKAMKTIEDYCRTTGVVLEKKNITFFLNALYEIYRCHSRRPSLRSLSSSSFSSLHHYYSLSLISLSLPLWQKDIMDKVLIVYLTPLARDLLGPQYTVYLLHAWILFTRWERPMAATPTQKNKWLRPIHSEATNLIFLCYFVKLQALKQNFQKVNFTFNNFFSHFHFEICKIWMIIESVTSPWPSCPSVGWSVIIYLKGGMSLFHAPIGALVFFLSKLRKYIKNFADFQDIFSSIFSPISPPTRQE